MIKITPPNRALRLNLLQGLALIALLGLLGACVAPLQPNLPSPTPVPTQIPSVDRSISAIGVSLQLKGSASDTPEIAAGSMAHILLDLVPSLVTFRRRQDGSVFSVEWGIWKDVPNIQMRTCFSAAVPCSPSDAWTSFQSQISYDVPVDWLGERTFYASTEFRASTGENIPTGELNQEKVNSSTSLFMTVTSIFTSTPATGQIPAVVLTEQAATQAAFPVTGSILIENGRCCAGGTEGTQIPLNVQLQAFSDAGKVTEMRSAGGSCQRNSASLDAPWEPLVSSKTYTVTLPLNWSMFQLNVQYRDEKGNLSPVYCAQISLEGMPQP